MIIRLVCYACKRTDYKQQFYYTNLLLIKILTQKIFVFKTAKIQAQRHWAELTVNKTLPSRPERVKDKYVFPFPFNYNSMIHLSYAYDVAFLLIQISDEQMCNIK